MKVTLLSYTKDPEKVIAAAIRQCYSANSATVMKRKMTDVERAKMIKMVIGSGHTSTIEHASFTFAIEGVSRVLTHELVRHRIASYCLDGDTMTETYYPASRRTKKRSIKELFQMKATAHGRSRLKLVKIKCMNQTDGTIVQSKIADVIYSGKKPVFEISLANGRKIKTTKDHLFYTSKSWMRLEEVLREKVKLAVNGLPISKIKELHDYKWLEKEYLNKNRMITDIADQLGIAEITVRKYIHKHGLRKSKCDYPNRRPGYGRKGMFSTEVLKLLSVQKQGSKNPQWKGGITSRAQVLRKTITKETRQEIYKRDGYSCRLCGKIGGRLTLHHVRPLYNNGSVVDVENLVTLCWPCHCKVNNLEPNYARVFANLESIPYRSRIQSAKNKWIIHFIDIVSAKFIGIKDTYDVVMTDPHHNFLANGIVVHNSQQSQRYINGKNFGYVVPPTIIAKKDATKIFAETIKDLGEKYEKLIELGIPKEDARFVLPNATDVKIVVTMNARSLFNFLARRMCNRAQWEIRTMAYAMHKKLMKVAPKIFRYAGPTCKTEDICWEGERHCGLPDKDKSIELKSHVK